MHNAILSYASNDVETVNKAADTIRNFISERYESKIQELEKRIQFGSKPPVGNGKVETPVKTITQSELMDMKPPERIKYFNEGGQIEG